MTTEVLPDVSLYAPDFGARLDIHYGEEFAGIRTVTSYLVRNVRENPSDVHLALSNAEGSSDIETYTSNFGEYSSTRFFRQISKYPALVHGLGYSVSEEETVRRGVLHRKTTFEYPTPEYLNDALSFISPDEGIRFKEYEGGKYSAVEGLEALLDNYILLAEEEPFRVHDHSALHALGYIGFVGTYLDRIKEFVEPYLKRYHAELELPPVPGLDNARTSTFLRPSHEVLKGIMLSLDGISNDVATRVLTKLDESEVNGDAPLLMGVFERPIPDRPSDSNIPPSIRLDTTHQERADFARDIERRYANLNDRVSKF